MQMFIAQLSTPIEKSDFETSWSSDPCPEGKRPKVQFTFAGRKVSAIIDSEASERWPAPSFYRAFSAAIRRIDSACNIRWL